MKMPGKCTGPDHQYLSVFFLLSGESVTLEVRRVDRQGEVLIYARRQRMGPKIMNCCRSEQVGTKEHSKMLERIQILERGNV